MEEFVIHQIHSFLLFSWGTYLWHAELSLKVYCIFQRYYFMLPVGFRRKEFRGKLAIAITANFINRNTTAEAKVEEISGVAFIFNQKFFQDLREATGLPAIVRFLVKTICLYYYNFVSQVSCLVNKWTSCAGKSVIAVSLWSLTSPFLQLFCTAVQSRCVSFRCVSFLFRSGECISLKVFRKSEP